MEEEKGKRRKEREERKGRKQERREGDGARAERQLDDPVLLRHCVTAGSIQRGVPGTASRSILKSVTLLRDSVPNLRAAKGKPYTAPHNTQPCCWRGSAIRLHLAACVAASIEVFPFPLSSPPPFLFIFERPSIPFSNPWVPFSPFSLAAPE